MQLQNHAAHAARHGRTWGIIAVQDPPDTLPWRVRHPYEYWCHPYGPLGDDQNPPRLARVAFLVHESLGKRGKVTWSVELHDEFMATLTLTTKAGPTRFHNV